MLLFCERAHVLIGGTMCRKGRGVVANMRVTIDLLVCVWSHRVYHQLPYRGEWVCACEEECSAYIVAEMRFCVERRA